MGDRGKGRGERSKRGYGSNALLRYRVCKLTALLALCLFRIKLTSMYDELLPLPIFGYVAGPLLLQHLMGRFCIFTLFGYALKSMGRVQDRLYSTIKLLISAGSVPYPTISGVV